jgi:hypothetical protein
MRNCRPAALLDSRGLREPNLPLGDATADAVAVGRDDQVHVDRTLVERALDGLGPPRWLWRFAWGALPFVTLAVTVAFARPAPPISTEAQFVALTLPAAALGYVVVLFLWGSDRLLRAIRGLGETVQSIEAPAIAHGRWSATGAVLPVVAALLLTTLDVAEHIGTDGVAGGMLAGLPDFLSHLAVTTFAGVITGVIVRLVTMGLH